MGNKKQIFITYKLGEKMTYKELIDDITSSDFGINMINDIEKLLISKLDDYKNATKTNIDKTECLYQYKSGYIEVYIQNYPLFNLNLF